GRAVQDYEQAIKLDPKFELALAGRCVARALDGDARQALNDCNQALRRQPNNVAVLDTRAFVYLRMGRLWKAIRDYDTVLRIDPEIADTRYGQNMEQLRHGYRGTAKTAAAAAKTIETGMAEDIARHGED